MDRALRTRLLSALFFAPILLAAFSYDWWSLELALLLIVGQGARELERLLRRLELPAPPLAWVVGPLAFLAAAHFGASGWWRWPSIVLAVLATVWLFLPGRGRRHPRGVGGLLVHLLAQSYLGLSTSHLLRLAPGPWVDSVPEALGARWVLYALFLVWAGDTGGYLAGRALGRHKLWPEVSPAKTIEGALGGILLTIAAGILLAPLLAPGLSGSAALALGALAGVAAPLGDLVESRLKRLAGIKDSGASIPGHGGVLDRFDSLLYAAPLLYYYLQRFAG